MQKLINRPEDFVEEMLEGILAAHGDELRRADDLRALVCALVGICYDADTRQRFVAWLRSVRPTTADLAVMMVEMALRHTPVGEQGKSRYVLVGFQPDGEPLIDLRTVS